MELIVPSSTEIVVERVNGAYTSIGLNRPSKKNALSPSVLKHLLEAIRDAMADGSGLVFLQSHVPGIFSAGFDLNFIGTDEDQPAHELMYQCFDALEQGEKVCVSYADGNVVGGGVELFLACDLRLATPASKFRLPPAELGGVYSYRGMNRFIRKLGTSQSAGIFLAAETYNAQDALRMGLVTKIVESRDTAEAFCSKTASLSMPAQRAMKAIINQISSRLTSDQSERDWHRMYRLQEAAERSGDLKERAKVRTR